MKQLPTLLLATLLFLAPATAQETGPVTGLLLDDPVADAIIQEADENGQVMEILDDLVNGIGPRLTSSTNLTDACHWVADRFEEWGLQNVRLVEWGTFPVGFDRGLMRGRLTQPVKQPLRFWTRAWTAGTDGPVRARVMSAPKNMEELDSMKGRLGGAWVLLAGIRPRWDNDQEDFPSGLARFLDAEKVAGVLMPTRTELILTGGRSRIEYDNLPTRVFINLQREDAKMLGRLLEEGEEVVAEFEIQSRFVEGPIPLYNVIGEIPGSEFPDQLVIFGGHLDSWDGATGTQDNGTGTATTMEAARILGKLDVRPKRTIRFMLWTGEEQGLLGSRAYIEAHPEEKELISAVIVHDGGTNALTGILSTPAMTPILTEALAPIVDMVAGYEDSEIEFEIQERNGLPRGIGSDHDAYLREGVPGFFWRQKGRSSYNYVHHTQHDFYESAEADYQEHSAKVVAIAAWRLANLPDMLPRDSLTGPPPRRLGVYLADDGLTINEVRPGGLAAKAGLLKKDKLLKVGDKNLGNRRDLMRAIRAEGARKKVVFDRDGEHLAFWFDWEKQEAAPAEPSAAGTK